MFLLILIAIYLCSISSVDSLKNTGHVVLITPPFFGHMIPLLDFAKRLSNYHQVTYIVSVSKLDALKKHGFLYDNEHNDLKIQSQIDFIGLFDHNDEEYEVANGSVGSHLESIFDRMREPLRQILFPMLNTSCSSSVSSLPVATHSIRRPIDLIISDVFVYSPVQEAYERNIMAYMFLPSNLGSYMRYMNVTRGNLEHNVFGPKFTHEMLSTLPHAKGLICNSIAEFDKQILDELRQSSLPTSNLTVHFVAPLMFEESNRKQNMDIIIHIKQWLNMQWEMTNKSPSVIYVAFGSMARFKPDQLIQIADVLKSYPFIWSLKSKFHTYVSSSFMDNQQHLLLDWAPQRFILSHPAIRLFVSHGGWNSLLESMSAGKPTLVWSLFADQIINGYRLEHELGMGQSIQNANFQYGQHILSSDEFRQYLKQMFDREDEYVEKARQVQQMVLHAKSNSSRICFEEIIKVINDQTATHLDKHSEL